MGSTAKLNPTESEHIQLYDIATCFEGRTLAWGLFEDRWARVQRRFNVEMIGRWQGQTFLLDEKFVYDTGEIEQRTWTVVQAGRGRFTATCPDCVGTATGSFDADSIRMSYRFRLKMNGRSIVVHLDDRIHHMTPDTAINRSTMTKWGIKLGELTLAFQRVPAATNKP